MGPVGWACSRRRLQVIHRRNGFPRHKTYRMRSNEIPGHSIGKLLVGGIPTPLKNMKVSWDDYSQYMAKYKIFQTTNQY